LPRGDRKWSLNDGQIPNTRVVRVALGTGYDRVQRNRRASRNVRVSDLPPEIPTVTVRCSAWNSLLLWTFFSGTGLGSASAGFGWGI
jgi:hypothetical protein